MADLLAGPLKKKENKVYLTIDQYLIKAREKA
jgi:hypothetical protein